MMELFRIFMHSHEEEEKKCIKLLCVCVCQFIYLENLIYIHTEIHQITRLKNINRL